MPQTRSMTFAPRGGVALPHRRRPVVCVPRHHVEHRLDGALRAAVEERLGSAYATVGELVVQLLAQQREVVRLKREMRMLVVGSEEC